MILNSYAVLLVFVALLRLVLGVVVLGVVASAWRLLARPDPASLSPEGRTALENRCYLVFLLALLLLGLNLASWPLLYLLLQSYVPEWPGVMCVYGVTQVGAGSLGSSRYLPDLLRFLQLTKPLLVFAGGAWFVLYLLNRRTKTAPLLGRLFVALLPLGLLAAADAAAELTYVAIPKKEEFPSGGCCVGTGEGDPARFLPPALVGDAGRPFLYAAYYGINLALLLGLFASTRRADQSPRTPGLAGLLLGGLAALLVSGLFLLEVAAPTLLHLPFHHCAYDLIPAVPEAMVAVALFIAGFFFLGWACVARWFGRSRETMPLLAGTVHDLLRLSFGALLMSLAMLSLELVLA